MKHRLFYGTWFSLLGILGLPLAFVLAWPNKNDQVGIETAFMALIFVPAIFISAAIYGQRIAMSQSWWGAFGRGICIVLLSGLITALLISAIFRQNPLFFLSMFLFYIVAGFKGLPLLLGGLSGVALRFVATRANG